MLFPSRFHAGLADGSITRAYRRWRRPTVKAGGTLVTPVGVLAIDAVTPIEPGELTDADARLAGEPDRTALLSALDRRGGETPYRIDFHLAGADPRIALAAEGHLSPEDVNRLRQRLAGLDRASRHGPWTWATLQLVADRPEVLAATLAAELGRARDPFKRDVRKLKELGLTVSCEVGYRVSPRGAALLQAGPLPRVGEEA